MDGVKEEEPQLEQQDNEELSDNENMDEEEEEPEREFDMGPPTKKRKHHKKHNKEKKEKKKKSAFIDDQAEDEDDPDGVDDDDDDDEEGGGDLGGFIDDATEDSGALRPAAAEGSMFLNEWQDREEEALVERYRGQQHEFDMHSSVSGASANKMMQHTLYPVLGVDPKLYAVKVKTGFARDIAMRLMQKAVTDAANKKPPLLKSCTTLERVKDMIYVEAYHRDHVTYALDGFQNVYRFSVSMIPVDQMTHLFRPGAGREVPKGGSWARLKRAEYKGDICQVIKYDDFQGIATVKVVPRVDIAEICMGQAGGGGRFGRRKKVRPAAKLFSKDDVEAYLDGPAKRNPVLEGLSAQDVMKFQPGDQFYKVFTRTKPMWFDTDGYLIKDCKLDQIDFKDVVPSVTEIANFDPKSKVDGRRLEGLKRAAEQLAVNDYVVVYEGEQAGLKGVIQQLDGTVVTVKPDGQYGISTKLQFPASALRKRQRVGDHVKITKGSHKGASGLIVAQSEDNVIITTDVSKETITVFASDVEACNETGYVGEAKAGKFALRDLIRLPGTYQAGVILRIQEDQFVVLLPDNTVAPVKIKEVTTKIHDRRAKVFDRNKSSVQISDLVKVNEGQYKGKLGTIMHITLQTLYLECTQITENNGLFAVRANQVTLLGGGLDQKNGPQNIRYERGDLPIATPTSAPRTPVAGKQFTRPSDWGGGSRGGRGRGRGGRGRGMLNTWSYMDRKRVQVIRGIHKGLMGLVVQTSEDEIRVELHTGEKTVSFRPQDLKLYDLVNDPSTKENPASSSSSFVAPQTPAWSQPPLYAAETPSYRFEEVFAPRSPAQTPSSMDPVWNPNADSDAVATPGVGSNVGTPSRGNAWERAMAVEDQKYAEAESQRRMAAQQRRSVNSASPHVPTPNADSARMDSTSLFNRATPNSTLMKPAPSPAVEVTTPGKDDVEPSGAAYWCYVGTVVKLNDRYDDIGGGDGAVSVQKGTMAVVKQPYEEEVEVQLLDDSFVLQNRIIKVPVPYLEPVLPSQKDDPVILTGYSKPGGECVQSEYLGHRGLFAHNSAADSIAHLQGADGVLSWAVVQKSALARYVAV